jgi:hypothetical protein
MPSFKRRAVQQKTLVNDFKKYVASSTLRTDVPLKERLDDLKWIGAYPRFKKLCAELGSERLPERVTKLR